jgi:5-methylcytosine-specific restriction endonuclease McrA
MFDFFRRKIRFAVRSPEWKEIRKLHLQNQDECQACGKKSSLEVHHIIPVHVDKHLELDPSNLLTLCDRCHLVFGHLSNYRSWNKNVVEDCCVYFNKVENRPYK